MLTGLSEVQASFMCRDYFAAPFAVTPIQLNYRPKPESFSPTIFKQKVGAEDLRRFQGNEGSLSLLAKFREKNSHMAHALVADNILHATLGFSLNDISGVKGSIDFFKNQDKKTLSDALRGQWGAKQNIYQLLRLISSWINEAYPKKSPVDLTRRDHFIEWLSFKEKNNYSERWDEILQNYRKYMNSIDAVQNESLGENIKLTDALIRKASELVGAPNDLKMLRSQTGLASLISRKTTTEVLQLMEDWTQKMHLSPKNEKDAMKALRIVAQNPLVNARSAADNLLFLNASVIRYFTHYVLPLRFPDYLSPDEKIIAYYDEFAKVQHLLLRFDAFYKRQEIQLEETLMDIEGFNNRIDQLLTQAESALSVASVNQKLDTEFYASLQKYSKKIIDLKIDDLNPQLLSERSAELERLQFNFEKTLHEFYRQKQKQEIDSVAELGAQWDLLLPQKNYQMNGSDFDSVVFSRDVIEYFQKNLERGSFFLTALSKGYVAHHNSSGLRRIPAIHPDFRDIKLLKHGGKVRIVGRLVERTIHFFFIYDHDQAYDDGEMRRVIQRFKPSGRGF
jgi:hypothetical protein